MAERQMQYNVADPSQGGIRGLENVGAGLGSMSSSRSVTVEKESNYGQAIADVGKAAVGIAGLYKQTKFDNDVNDFSAQLAADPNYAPDPLNKSVDWTAYRKAKVDQLTVEGKQLDLSNAKRKAVADDIVDRRMKFETYLGQGNASWLAGDMPSAVESMENAYKQINNGYTVKIDPENKTLTFTDRNGKSGDPVPFNTLEEMRERINLSAKPILGREQFAKSHLNEAAITRSQNVDAYVNGDTLVNQETGKVIGTLVKAFDPATGQPVKPVVHMTDGTTVEATESFLRNLVTQPDYEKKVTGGIGVDTKKAELVVAQGKEGLQRAQTAQANAQVNETKANTDLIKAKTGEVGKGANEHTHEREKLANFYVRAGIAPDIAAAVEIIRQDEQNKVAFGAIAKYLESDPDLSTPKGREEFIQYRDKVMQTSKEVVNSNTPKKGQGVNEKKSGQVTVDDVVADLTKKFPKPKEGAVKYLNKNKFIVTNGKWTYVEK